MHDQDAELFVSQIKDADRETRLAAMESAALLFRRWIQSMCLAMQAQRDASDKYLIYERLSGLGAVLLGEMHSHFNRAALDAESRDLLAAAIVGCRSDVGRERLIEIVTRGPEDNLLIAVYALYRCDPELTAELMISRLRQPNSELVTEALVTFALDKKVAIPRSVLDPIESRYQAWGLQASVRQLRSLGLIQEDGEVH